MFVSLLSQILEEKDAKYEFASDAPKNQGLIAKPVISIPPLNRNWMSLIEPNIKPRKCDTQEELEIEIVCSCGAVIDILAVDFMTWLCMRLYVRMIVLRECRKPPFLSKWFFSRVELLI